MTEAEPAVNNAPIDAIRERLNDPGVAASIVTLLDNTELLSTLVIGLSGFLERGEVIMDSVADAVKDLRTADLNEEAAGLPTLAELGTLARQANAASPVLDRVLTSSMVQAGTIDLLSMFSDAANEGMQRAKSEHATVGPFSLFKAMRDDEVAKGWAYSSRSLERWDMRL